MNYTIREAMFWAGYGMVWGFVMGVFTCWAFWIYIPAQLASIP